MSLHQNIKDQIKDALRAKDTIRLDALRGLSALAQNEMLASKTPTAELLPDDRILALVKKSAKQRKDSIDQFTKGNREDLVAKEQAELKILEAFLPAMMSKDEIKIIVRTRIDALKAQGSFDPKSAGKLVGMLMKELAGKADGADVKAAVDEVLK
jgi:uncharacterized protein YqeY